MSIIVKFWSLKVHTLRKCSEIPISKFHQLWRNFDKSIVEVLEDKKVQERLFATFYKYSYNNSKAIVSLTGLYLHSI